MSYTVVETASVCLVTPTTSTMSATGLDALRTAIEAAFPPVDFAMAYGSSVFTQVNHDASSSMIDLVFAVHDPAAWHADNLVRNPAHYSLLSALGPHGITAIQENYGAGVYYNTLVPLEIPGIGTRMVKYGVVRADTLCMDLAHWETLYLSGRMQKPVSILKSTEIIDDASSLNLSHALNFSLLSLPQKFTFLDLFMKIAGISYLGDFRMVFGENPRKVRNIVEGNYDAFYELYQHKIKNSPLVSISIHDPDVLVAKTDLADNGLFEVVRSLPPRLNADLNPVEVFTDRRSVQRTIKRRVATVVGRYSITQSIKGIATGGGAKTAMYIAAKLRRAYFKR